MNLVLFMTRGMSLAAWEDNGSLERELALYAALAREGWKTTVVSWGGEHDRAIAQRYPWLTVCVNSRHLPPGRYERLMPLLHARELAPADVIKSNQVNGADCALRCARLWRKPFVARCGYLWSQNSRDGGKEDLPQALALERDVFSGCDHGIVTTEAMRDYIEDSYGVAGDRLHVIPNYITGAWFEPLLPAQAPAANAVITHLGRLAEEKNCFALIDACVGLPVIVRFIGDGPLKEELRQHAQARGVEAEFTGTVPSAGLPDLLGQSAVVTLVSLYEGHPKALIEAMARGCAVLGTRVRGIEPCIVDGVTGLLCETDAASIRTALERLLADPGLRRRLGEAARHAALRFHVDAVAREELALYARLPKLSRLDKALAAGHLALRAIRKGGKKLHAMAEQQVQKVRASIGARKLRALPGKAKKLPATLSAKARGKVTSAIMRLVHWRLRDAPAADALRFLFDLESRLYPLEGRYSVAYDGGVHTEHRHTRCHDFFVRQLRPGERVLDIGCGNGFLAYDMAAKGGAMVTGIDLNADNIAVAHERHAHPNVRFAFGDAPEALPDERFDTVVLSNVLEHLPGRSAFLRRIRKQLRPGRFLLRVPLFERDWRVPLKKELGVEWRLDPTHETEYTREQFLCELARAGLFVEHEEIRWSEIWCVASDAVPAVKTAPAKPRVTVLMSVHNGEAYLETAVNSILRQTYGDFLFLILDDASTDATAGMLADFAARDARVRIVTNTEKLGLTASLNKGLRLVETPYVARMDADDISLPERLARQLEHMEAHPELAACGCLWALFDEDDPEGRLIPQDVPTSATEVRRFTTGKAPCISHPAAFLRTGALRAVEGYREAFTAAQDYDLWLRLLERGELDNLPTILHFYRRHGGAVSSARVAEQAICHVLAIMSAECRRDGLPDILASGPASLETLERHLDPARPSFLIWLWLLVTRPVDPRGAALKRALRLLETGAAGEGARAGAARRLLAQLREREDDGHHSLESRIIEAYNKAYAAMK
ncbi:MAG: glycosyltransferase [Desulfovibrio sp.]|uniref:glycosyltransferase n=1 Tax=Desulfovibrio sp. TaxID=885 RepID=UPI001A6E7970|nr:glycosyltransferase [Desulfovibrio sp.]MBD5416430.1 glycosyltransferase [Desulfovibrio sp.]